MWGPRQPAWRHLNDTMLFAARTSEMLKTGIPRADLAFYAWKHPWNARAVYQGSDLTAAGYTYEYLGPENLSSANISVRDGVLAPDGPAYKAIVLIGQTRITPLASAALLQFARQGLPIFIAGSIPNITIGAVGQDSVAENMAQLTKGGLQNVIVLSGNAFGLDTLQRAGILPRVSSEALEGAQNASQLFTTWRSEPDRGVEAAYLLNRGQTAKFGVSFTVPTNTVPYELDAWTGEQVPILTYLRTNDGINIQVALEKGQSTIIAFIAPEQMRNSTAAPLYVVGRSPNLSHVRITEKGNIEAYVEDLEEASALLSNNNEASIPALVLGGGPATISPVNLGPWALAVEAYAAPAVLSTNSVSVNRTKITVPTLSKLVPWTQIRGLERVSGVGTYRSIFTMPSPLGNQTQMGYTLHFTGRVLNSLRVRVNGILVPAIDPSAPSQGRDITTLVKETGENEIVVETSSTLFNAVKARMNDLRTVGAGVRVPRYYTQPQWAEFGLVGEVVIKRWRKVQLN